MCREADYVNIEIFRAGHCRFRSMFGMNLDMKGSSLEPGLDHEDMQAISVGTPEAKIAMRLRSPEASHRRNYMVANICPTAAKANGSTSPISHVAHCQRHWISFIEHGCSVAV